MQSIDDFNAPVHGVYVVRSCSPASSSPCSQPLVLARLTDIALPLAPTATPPPPATPVPQPTPTTASSYPSARALTTAELDQFLQTAEGIKDKVLVAQVSFAQTNGCAPVGSYKPIGLIAGMKSDVCVVGIGDGRPEHSPASTSGVSAFRVLDSHTLGFMGDISTASDGRLALTSADAWPDGKTILVNGWHTTGAGLIFCPMIPALTSDPLDPGAMPCGPTWMVTEPLPGPVSTTPPLSAHPQSVWWPAYPTGGLPTPDGEATYLLRDTNSDCNRNTGRYCGWRILGVVDSVQLPQAAPAPTPSGSSGTGLTTPGLWGSGNRPLTMAELLSAYKADRLHLTGRIVITKGPVPADLACATSFNFPETCQYLSETTTGGYWAVKVGADGKLGVVGEMSTANSSFVSSIAQANAAKVPADQVVVVDAWLDWANDCDTPSSTPPCFFSVLTNESVSWMHMRSLFPWDSVPAWEVQDDAYTTFGGDPTLQHPARGLYLVRPDGYGAATILARLETTSSTNP